MPSDNPFEVSSLYTGSGREVAATPDQSSYEVQDLAIICGSTVQLPEVCIFSGSRVNLVPIAISASYPTLRLVIRARKCVVRCWASRTIYRRRRWLQWIGTLLMFSPLLLCLGFEFGGRSSVGMAFFLLIAGIALRIGSDIRLVLERFEPPHRHHVVGFARPALAELARLAPKDGLHSFPN